MQSVKAKRIRQVSKAVLDEFGGSLSQVLDLQKAEARERIIELPRVGDKTVFLTIRYGHREVIPFDTHLDRITKRLGLANRDSPYKEIQLAEFYTGEI